LYIPERKNKGGAAIFKLKLVTFGCNEKVTVVLKFVITDGNFTIRLWKMSWSLSSK